MAALRPSLKRAPGTDVRRIGRRQEQGVGRGPGALPPGSFCTLEAFRTSSVAHRAPYGYDTFLVSPESAQNRLTGL